MPNEYVLQNAPKGAPEQHVTWTQLYQAWERECARREATKAAYPAAMQLFAEFNAKGPVEVTIEQICGHEPGTVGGKYGLGLRLDVLTEELNKLVPPVALPIITAAPAQSAP